MNSYTAELAQALFEDAGDALFLFDPVSEQIHRANAAAQRLTGWTSEELAPMPLSTLFRYSAPGNKQRMKTACEQSGVFHSQEGYFLRSKHGPWVPVNLTISRLHVQPKPLGLLTCRDVTERQRAAQALREREQHLRAIIETSPECIKLVHPDGGLLEINGAGLHMLEADTAEQVVGQKVLQVVAPEHRQRYWDFHASICEGGRGTLDFDIVGLKGGRRTVATMAVPLSRPDGTVVHLGITRDVTDSRRLEDRLVQVQKLEAVGRLAGGVAHDFNNLLTAINGFSEMIMVDLPVEDPVREMARQIRKAGERAAVLTRQLLTFSRRQVTAPIVLDLAALLQETGKLLRRLIGEDIALTIEAVPDLAHIKVDVNQFEQTVVNLAVNARDAMPTGGRLTIEARNVHLDERAATRHGVAAGDYVCLQVQDTGCGMDEATKARIFEPFFTTKPVGQGTGLGLSTVYGTVQQCGGFLEVTSAPGQGSTFTLYFPASDAPASDRQSVSDFQAPPVGIETILLVEDEPAVRTLARNGLEEFGYTILEAEDGESALRRCQDFAGEIDLLVTDVVMPRMGGRELADRLTALRPQLKVLFVSGHMNDMVIWHGIHEASVAFL
ncbi:MAG: PAS domain S-box protein, partial [Planctomycetia bacterium]|nr:PAS domain S-box protein [Planctomycetia bacterium]